MGKFTVQNGLIGKNNSTITGSLNISGSITGGFFGTSSYVVSSSYALNADIASYTTATSSVSAVYASSSTSASYALTASIDINPAYAPTPNIGYISPTIYFGGPEVSGTVAAGNFGGLLLSPVLINRNCSLTTMSIVGSLNVANMTCSFALYSNSTSTSLPEYLLFSGSFSSSITGTSSIYNVNVSPTLSLQSDTVYWVGFVGSANFRWYYGQNVINIQSYTPLLGSRLSTSTTGQYTSPNFIRTGSTYNAAAGAFFALPATASQITSSYTYNGLALSIPIMPVLKVTY
jgi:hypothetical protein